MRDDGARAFQASVTLRIIAVAIAIAAVVDPAISIVAATRPRLAIVLQNRDDAKARGVRDDLTRDLAVAYDIVPHIVSDAAAAVVIGERYPAEPVPDALPVWTVTMPATTGARIVRAAAPPEVPPATAIRIDADLDIRDARDRTTTLRARVAGVESAVVSHRWSSDREVWHASIDVVPAGDPPFVVRLEATTGPAGAAASARDVAAVDLVVGLRSRPLAVQFFDARPSWASTFVRRALESDPRFRIESVILDARGLTARTSGGVAPGDRRLDAFDAVAVGGLDRLSAADVAALDRYMRERGGAVVLLPDQRIENAALAAWLPAFSERLLERPAPLAPPRGGGTTLPASELLVASTLPIGAEVVLHAPGNEPAAVVLALPHGEGRLLVSGAMDAWRSRGTADAAFDRFWQSTIAGIALPTPPALDVAVMPPLARPRETAAVVVRVHGGTAGSVSASAEGQPVRLVPGAERGVFRGTIVGAEHTGRMTLDVHAADTDGRVESVRRIVPIVADARPATAIGAPLALLSASHRGADAPPDRIREIEQSIRGAVPPSRAAARRHPMRSPWWIAPFAACLSAEWWLRRRRGLR